MIWTVATCILSTALPEAACSISRHLFRSQTAGIPFEHIVTVAPKRESAAQKYWNENCII